MTEKVRIHIASVRTDACLIPGGVSGISLGEASEKEEVILTNRRC